MPTDRVHRLIDIKLARGLHRWQCPRRSATGPGLAALHQIQQQCTRLEGIALATKQCNAAPSSAMPLSNKYQCGDAPQLSS